MFVAYIGTQKYSIVFEKNLRDGFQKYQTF